MRCDSFATICVFGEGVAGAQLGVFDEEVFIEGFECFPHFFAISRDCRIRQAELMHATGLPAVSITSDSLNCC